MRVLCMAQASSPQRCSQEHRRLSWDSRERCGDSSALDHSTVHPRRRSKHCTLSPRHIQLGKIEHLQSCSRIL
eukprot:SAG31_NODE_1034_length_10228_cov_89.107316_4_plen_73_part_00